MLIWFVDRAINIIDVNHPAGWTVTATMTDTAIHIDDNGPVNFRSVHDLSYLTNSADLLAALAASRTLVYPLSGSAPPGYFPLLTLATSAHFQLLNTTFVTDSMVPPAPDESTLSFSAQYTLTVSYRLI